MPVHKLIHGGEQWLPFALSKLRQLARADRNAGRSWTMPDGAFVQLRIVGDQQFVTISGSAPRYEFYTSDHVVDYPCYGSPGHVTGWGTGQNFVCGSFVRARPLGSSKPLSSSTIAPPAPDDWHVRGCEDFMGADEGVITWASWQNQKFFECPWWPHNGKDSLVTSVQAQAPGIGNMAGWMSSRSASRLGNVGMLVADAGLDVKPALYSKDGVTIAAPRLEYSWLWWRRAAVQTAGGRQFFISTDNYGRFQVYPVKAYPDNTADTYVLATPPYPSWVTVPDPTDYQFQVCHWLWQFNKDATRVAACAFHSDVGPFSKHLEKRVGAILPEVATTLHPDEQAGLVPERIDTPGLVEFGITITVNGPGEWDFDVSFELLRSSYFNTDGRYFFDCGYALPGIEGVDEDTLITAEMEVRVPPGGYSAGPESAEDYPLGNNFVHSVQWAQSSVVVNANGPAMERTELFKWDAWGPVNTRFLTIDGYRAGASTGTWYGYIPATGADFRMPDGSSQFIYANSAVQYGTSQSSWGIHYGQVHSMDLRSCSFLVDQISSVSGADGGHRLLIAFGKTIKDIALNPIGAPSPAYTGPAATVLVPPQGRDLYDYAVYTTLNMEWGQGFSVHPEGHWSHSVNAGLQRDPYGSSLVDIVQAKGKAPTSHKALFNRAYGQTRDHSYYAAPFTGKVQWDMGSFRTAGLWITF